MKRERKLKDNYIIIQSWMRCGLGLSGNQLLIYAIIYGFSQAEGQVCTCGDEYMAEWIGASERTVINIKNDLLAAGLIEKVEVSDGDKRYSGYAVVHSKIGENFSHNSLQILNKIGEKISPKLREKTSCNQQICEKISHKIGENFSRATDNKNNNKYIFVVDEETRARVGELASLITIDCEPIHSQEEYSKAVEELKRSDWARDNLTHLSKIHNVWGKLVSGYYRNHKNTATPPTTNFSADQINAAFAELNNEL